MTTITTTETLDELDHRIITFVHDYRREHSLRPHWSEVRAHIGLAPTDLSVAAFTEDWGSGGGERWEERRPFRYYRANHPEQSEEGARRRWQKQAYSRWRWQQKQGDPLNVRLERLKSRGHITFTTEERSLDITSKVSGVEEREGQEAAGNGTASPSTSAPPVSLGQLSQRGVWHVLRRNDDGSWSAVCRSDAVRPSSVRLAPQTPVCGKKACRQALG